MHKITHMRQGYYEKSYLYPQLGISSCKLYLNITQSPSNMGLQSLKKAHISPKKKKSFSIFSKILKNIYKWAPSPIPKLHNVLIVGTKPPRSKQISNPIMNQKRIHKYI